MDDPAKKRQIKVILVVASALISLAVLLGVNALLDCRERAAQVRAEEDAREASWQLRLARAVGGRE